MNVQRGLVHECNLKEMCMKKVHVLQWTRFGLLFSSIMRCRHAILLALLRICCSLLVYSPCTAGQIQRFPIPALRQSAGPSGRFSQ
jgi:hypothetical protein